MTSFISYLLFEYDTVKFIHIKSRVVGILSRLIQLAIVGYLIGFVLVWKKGYQVFDDVESAVTTKVKGVVYPNVSDSDFEDSIDPRLYKRIWDVADYVVPSSENGAFFVTTNIEITPNQELGTCPEDYGIDPDLIICYPDNNTCTEGKAIMLGNGVMTGNCVKSDINSTINVCEIYAWCPVEKDINPLKNNTALLTETKDFTVMIKNSVFFPLFNIRRRNIKDTTNKKYLQTCRYQPHSHEECPVFRLGDIINYMNANETGQKMDYDELSIKGGVVAIIINWDCNFDFSEDYCMPKYSFRRLDNPEAKIAPGWNFRYAHYYNDTVRTLFKAYGIKFVVQVTGKGGKFNVVPLLLNIGSGLGLLAVSAFICDIVTLYFLKKREYYRSTKYEEVNDVEDTIDVTTCIPPKKRENKDGNVNYQTLENEGTGR